MDLLRKASNVNELWLAKRSPSPSLQFVAAGAMALPGLAWLSWTVVSASGAALTTIAAFIAAMTLALTDLRARYPHPFIGLCNLATMLRLGLVAVLFGALFHPSPNASLLLAIGTLAFALDGADGWLARRAKLTSDFGARFDMEVDSTLALVLALLVWTGDQAGAYVLLLGIPRYAFALAQWALPWLARDLPERFSRKLVCVLQIAALLVALLSTSSGPPVLLLAILAVAWSFAYDIRWLWKAAR